MASGESEWEPHDIRGFLRRLRNHAHPVGKIVLKYVEEALRVFNARCFLALSVMLGTASEQAVNELGISVITTHRDPDVRGLADLLTGAHARAGTAVLVMDRTRASRWACAAEDVVLGVRQGVDCLAQPSALDRGDASGHHSHAVAKPARDANADEESAAGGLEERQPPL